MAIIGILAGITFGVAKGVMERAAISQARAEVAVLAQALEAFRKQYGDYPQTGGAAAPVPDTTSAITVGSASSKFFNALGGILGPEMAIYSGKPLIEFSKFTLEKTNYPDISELENAILDPWGRRYLYFYKAPDLTAPKTYTWTNPSYVLYSAGPDGAHTAPTSAGIVNEVSAGNADNIYANR